MTFKGQYGPVEFNGVVRDIIAHVWTQPGITVEYIRGNAVKSIDPEASSIACENNRFGTVSADWLPPLMEEERYPKDAFYKKFRNANGVFYSSIIQGERTTLVFQVIRESEAENKFKGLLTLEQVIKVVAKQRKDNLILQKNAKEEWVIPLTSESKGYLPGEPHIRVLHIVFSSENQVTATLYESKGWINGYLKPSADIFNTVETELGKTNADLKITCADWYLSAFLGNVGQAQWNRIDCGVYCVLFTQCLVQNGTITREFFNNVNLTAERHMHELHYLRIAEQQEFGKGFDPQHYEQLDYSDDQNAALTEAELAVLREFFTKILAYFQIDDLWHSTSHRLNRMEHFYKLLETIAKRQLENYDEVRRSAPTIFGFGYYASMIRNTPAAEYYTLKNAILPAESLEASSSADSAESPSAVIATPSSEEIAGTGANSLVSFFRSMSGDLATHRSTIPALEMPKATDPQIQSTLDKIAGVRNTLKKS